MGGHRTAEIVNCIPAIVTRTGQSQKLPIPYLQLSDITNQNVCTVTTVYQTSQICPYFQQRYMMFMRVLEL
jgi:hypothetical protein